MPNFEFSPFSGYGIEIEYMIVGRDSLDVAPVADRLLDLVGGAEDMDVDRGEAAWSNELALHVVEIKTAGPARDLSRAAGVLRQQVDEINGLLDPLGCRLMPGGIHPWMDPHRETKLWPHQNDEIYRAFDRIFDCRGHGWSNLQSTHINFPFQTDGDFEKLHAACRVVLPLLPALAASSPFWEAGRGPALDTRLVAYQGNCARIPSVTGRVIPEVQRSEGDYQRMLAGIYADLAPLDPEGVLAHEWVNARGAIARFDRGAVEIRVLDAQECPEQDLAVVAFVTELVRALSEGEYGSVEKQHAFSTEGLKKLLDRSVISGREAILDLEGYSALFGSSSPRAGELLQLLIDRHVGNSSPFSSALRVISESGNLAERLVSRCPVPSKDSLQALYGELCQCLALGRAFVV